MARKPLIGISNGLQPNSKSLLDIEHLLPLRYVRCVVEAGGLPVGIPVVPRSTMLELLAELQGIVLVGGPDLPPETYGETNVACESLALPQRVDFDFALIGEAAKLNKPLLGICYGHQAMNVHFGGKLVQDIASQLGSGLKHRRSPDEPVAPCHDVHIEPGSRLAGFLGAPVILAASAHHQAVREPGAGFRVTAHAPDGVVEACEHPGYRFLISVQWHPEMTPEADHTRRLLGALVEAASETVGPEPR